MWQLEKVKIENLFSHIETEYSFNQNNCTLIYGKNKSDSGKDSNGAGKSVLVEAICIALTGLTCRDVDKEQFIRRKEESCLIELTLFNKSINKKLSILRQFSRGKESSKVFLFENDELNDQITSPGEANKKIIELIGISREDLIHYFIIGQKSGHSFFTAGDSERKEIISRFTNANLIDEVIKYIEKEKAEKSEGLEEAKSEVQKIENFISLTKERIEVEKETFSETLKDEIKSLKEELLEKEEEIIEEDKQAKNYEKENEELKDELKVLKIKLIDTSKTEDKIKKLKRENLNNQKELEEGKESRLELKVSLSGKVKCPKCETLFIPDSILSIEEIKETLEELDSVISSNEEFIEENKNNIKSLQKKLEESEVRKNKIRIKEQKINSNSRLITSSVNFISSLKSKQEKISLQISKKQKELKGNGKILVLQNELKAFEERLIKAEAAYSDLIKIVEDYDFWINNFGRNGFKTYLANQSLKTIEGMTNSFLQNMNTGLTVLMSGYTILKSGEIREKIKINVFENGLEEGDYNAFSGGEGGRIDIAGILAIQKLINLSAKNGGLNLLILDEKFEGLDTTGQKAVLNILSNTGITTLVISHNNNSIGFVNELVIEKVKKISRIVA